MRLLVNLLLSMGMLALCAWLVWPNETQRAGIEDALERLRAVDLLPYLGLLATTHFFRAWRWNNLLAPLDVRLPGGRLLAISSVGFMAILALPARLGEFVRPALIRKKGEVSASEALGTVAVERIVDGLLVSIFVFGALFALRGPDAPSWMMPTAYAALGAFTAATFFLGCALRWPEKTVNAAVAMTLTPRLSPVLASWLRRKLHDLIRGFLVLRDPKNLCIFILWSIVYWGANGLSLWVLAQAFDLELSVVGAFAVMGLVAVGITLPNAPGLIGQYQYFTVLGLTLYLPGEVANTEGLAFALVLHGMQVVWYIGVGALALATPYVSLSEVVASRSMEDHDDDGP